MKDWGFSAQNISLKHWRDVSALKKSLKKCKKAYISIIQHYDPIHPRKTRLYKDTAGVTV